MKGVGVSDSANYIELEASEKITQLQPWATCGKEAREYKYWKREGSPLVRKGIL